MKMLKKRYTIVSILTLIVLVMMLFIDFSNSMKNKEQMSEDLIQKENVTMDVNPKCLQDKS